MLEMAALGSTGSCHSQWEGRQTYHVLHTLLLRLESCSSFRDTPESTNLKTGHRDHRLIPPYIHDVLYPTDKQKIYGRIHEMEYAQMLDTFLQVEARTACIKGPGYEASLLVSSLHSLNYVEPQKSAGRMVFKVIYFPKIL